MVISLVVAASTNHAIGKNNQLLWHLPNDLKRFKNLTWGMPIVMGRRTFDSIGKPLPGRKNIVITRQKELSKEGVAFVTNKSDIDFIVNELEVNELYVIGGGELYRTYFNLASVIHMTRVHTEIEGDTFFPEMNPKEWERTHFLDCKADEKHAFDYTFEVWKRIR